MKLELIQTLTQYHVDMSHRIWDSIEQITEEQFLMDDEYSRGSIRNLIVHLASTERRWLAGLRNLPDVGHLAFDHYKTKETTLEIFAEVVKDLSKYIKSLSEEELNQNANDIPNPRWAVLLHLVNHGTDHRATVLQRLHEFGAPTFDQDFILWLWSKN
jgi:uncharacterized damage-inducible protein DinB